MTGVLDGVRVLDLTWGVAGPMATMLFADHGATVTKIEPPGGDPFRNVPGYHVWQRGKRSAELDLKTDAGRRALLDLARTADVLVESFSPGTTARLGIDYETLSSINPRLVYCSITGYGRDTPMADRPAYDALVAARTGLHWEQRGVPSGTPDRLAGRPVRHEDLDVPQECSVGALRKGPLFPGVPWPSMGTMYITALGISAALRAREVTGRGQWVETSLLQGAMATCAMPWLRAEHPDAPNYWTWVMDERAPKGLFECADGRWVLHWPMLPQFVLGASEGDELRLPTDRDLSARSDPARIGLSEDDFVVLVYYYPLLAEAFRRFPAHQWAEIAAQADVACQVVRSPEEALQDPLLLADGCVTEVLDPDLGLLHQVGRVYELEATPIGKPGPLPRRGEHTEAVLQEAKAAAGQPAPQAGAGRSLSAPLDGITVLDLGLALAGPFGAQCLADLGARVIKINALHDTYWHSNHIAMGGNRGKRSLAVNLKDPRGLAVLQELVAQADVVHTNMRYEAAERLGVDYESLKKFRPDLIYCHTRGFERGPREALPGNDQTGSALAGVQWEDGGLGNGGRPYWSLTSLGDTGNGFLSAIAVTQALYHRDRTGEGQKVGTSIIYAHLLNSSYIYTLADGAPAADRPAIDGMGLGYSPRYRIYETGEGWMCVAALEDAAWKQLCEVVGASDVAGIEAAFRTKPAAQWFDLLDGAGVPVEVCSETFAVNLFDDEDMKRRGWVTRYHHDAVGELDQVGLTIGFSETPGRVQGPPVIVGRESREILREFGIDEARIDQLCEAGVVFDRGRGA
jgi:crotonobetainyl-CoA:carnitine CoA-transferase CaiB-like acyl-CoA transferase